MALATKCPHCNTIFRVAADQLKLRGGIVRCGTCHEVFDGNATLIAPAAAAPLAAAAPDETPADAAAAEAAATVEHAETAPAPEDPPYELDFDTSYDPFGVLPACAQAVPEPGTEPESGIEPEAAQAATTDTGPGSAPEPALDAHTAAEPRPEPAAETVEPAFDHDMEIEPEVEPEAAPAAAITPPAQERFPLPTTPSHDDRREPWFGPEQEEADEYIVASALPDDDEPPAARPVAPANDAAPEPESIPITAPAVDDEAGEAGADSSVDEPGFVKQGRRRERTGKALRIGMALGALLLFGALLAQGATTFRNQLAVQLPQLRPALVSACAALGCRLELPAQIEMLAIEQGELQTLTDTTFSYTSVLRNQGNSPQTWPHLELTLNDADDKPVLRRVFTPRDYLAPTVNPGKGFAARSEQAVKLYFELARLKASGYHIAVFYP